MSLYKNFSHYPDRAKNKNCKLSEVKKNSFGELEIIIYDLAQAKYFTIMLNSFDTEAINNVLNGRLLNFKLTELPKHHR
jgi:hypothetical protein